MFQDATPPSRSGPGSDPADRPGSRVGLTRRRFLASLGLVAGAGALLPAIHRARRGGPRRLEAGRLLMGTWVRVVVVDADETRATRALERAFAAMREVDAQMSIHREDTDLARVNRAAGERAVRVAPAVVEVTASALDAARRTGGVYDPTVLPLMRLYGFYGPARDTLPSAAEIDATLARMGHERVEVDRAASTLALARPGMGLDLGSLGKGWAVDRAVAALRAEGIRSALVDAGGKVYGLGTPGDGGDGWSVGLFHPATGRCERVFALRDAAVGTSGNSERYRTVAGHRLGHLFDARRGRPSEGHLSASVLARTAMEADRLCTVAFLVGPAAFRGWPGALDTAFIG